MNKNDFYQKILADIKEGKEIPKMCALCGEDDSRILKKFEAHHIFGKVNSDEKVWLCPNCHIKITLTQNSFPPKIRSNNATDLQKFAFQLISQGELLIILGEKQKEIARMLLPNG